MLRHRCPPCRQCDCRARERAPFSVPPPTRRPARERAPSSAPPPTRHRASKQAPSSAPPPMQALRQQARSVLCPVADSSTCQRASTVVCPAAVAVARAGKVEAASVADSSSRPTTDSSLHQQARDGQRCRGTVVRLAANAIARPAADSSPRQRANSAVRPAADLLSRQRASTILHPAADLSSRQQTSTTISSQLAVVASLPGREGPTEP